MSYTHYWFTNRRVGHENWARAFRAAGEIVMHSPVPLAGSDGEGEPEISDVRIVFNGAAPEAGEACVLFADAAIARNTKGSRKAEDWSFDFCATHHEPYDVVLTAVLASLQEVVGTDDFLVTSDGDADQWRAGCELASRVLGRNVPVPPGVVDPADFDKHSSQE